MGACVSLTTWTSRQIALGRGLLQFKMVTTSTVASVTTSNSLTSQVGAGDDDGDPMDVSLAKLESEAKEVALVTAPINSIATTRFAMLKATATTH